MGLNILVGRVIASINGLANRMEAKGDYTKDAKRFRDLYKESKEAMVSGKRVRLSPREKLALEDLNEDLKVVDTALVEGWTKTGEVQSELLKMFAKNLKKEIGRRLSTEFLPERVNIAAIVRNEALRAKDKFGDFEISIESDKPIKLIEADHYMLKAIVRRMMEESASSFAGERQVKVTLKEEKGMLSLTHEDTGAHVPEGKDPMWKVQDYVNKHDGYLSYHNKPEGGRRFMLTLPKERKLKA